MLDLGATRQVSSVDLTLVGQPTSLSLYVTDTNPADLTGLKVAGRTTVTGTTGTLTLDQPASGRYVVVWLTRLPAVPGGFRGEVADVVVRGE